MSCLGLRVGVRVRVRVRVREIWGKARGDMDSAFPEVVTRRGHGSQILYRGVVNQFTKGYTQVYQSP